MKIEVPMRYWTTLGEAGKDPGIGWSRAHLTPYNPRCNKLSRFA